MIQLKILSGKMAGAVVAVRHFPFHVGRVAGSNLQLEEPGVWDKHLQLTMKAGEGFVLASQPNAVTTVNGTPAQTVVLRNGDLIELGHVKVRFWLGQIPQSSLRARELLIWLLIAVISVGQVALIYWISE